MKCANPEHEDAGATCAACARACEAELSSLNDRYMRLLTERRRWQDDVRAAAARNANDHLNAFALWRIELAMGELTRPLREIAGRASVITPDMALARHRDEVAAFQRAARWNLRNFDQAHQAAARDAARLWATWRAENNHLRALVARAGRELHDHQAQYGDQPCHCEGCELIRAMDRVPVTPELDGLPAEAAE